MLHNILSVGQEINISLNLKNRMLDEAIPAEDQMTIVSIHDEGVMVKLKPCCPVTLAVFIGIKDLVTDCWL